MGKNQSADGAAGARRAAAVLSIALCAETSNSTMDEEGAKIDLKIGFRDPFAPKSIMHVNCQVKHGDSYRAENDSPEFLKIKIDKETTHSLRMATGPGLLIWIPPVPSPKLHWHIVDYRGVTGSPAKFLRWDIVSPSLRYKLSQDQCIKMRSSITKHDVAKLNINSVHAAAKSAYSNLKGTIRHPFLGSLCVTNYAWRHVTRRSKTEKNRIRQLRIVPYLKSYLSEAPTRFERSKPEVSHSGKKTHEKCDIFLRYNAAFNIDGVSCTLFFRAREVVSYPTNWLNHPLSTKAISQTVTLVSWWYKEEK